MMYGYPFFSFPRFRKYYPYGYNNSYYTSQAFNGNLHNLPSNYNEKALHKEEQQSNYKKNEATNDAPLFEVFGLKLYFDDILIISLIFFLYQEGVQDQYLFTALILLLLS